MRAIWIGFTLAGCVGPTAATPASPPAALATDLPVPSPLNDHGLPSRAADAPFRFLVAGHLYGDMSAAQSPARTIVAARSRILAIGADLLLACGDTFRVFAPPWIGRTDAELRRLPLPVFNSIGNHDATDRARYVATYGATWGAFVHAGCLFVQLDTELEPWEVGGEQLAFLGRVLDEAMTRTDLRAVFCFGHKVVFAARQRYFALATGCNAHDGLQTVPRFAREVLPLLAAVALRKPVFWFAGDVGASHTLPCFFDRDPSSGVCFVATGVGDLPRDMVVEVAVEGGDVRLRTVGLTGAPVPPITDFGVSAWERHVFADGMSEQQAALRATLPP